MAILAYDRAGSVRTFDDAGRLRVEITPISKANICEYLGSEIPGYAALGLQPEKRYRLLRDPDELARSVDTFNLIPVLDNHVPTSANAHPRDATVGSTADNAVFEAPYLKVGLVIFDGETIRKIQSGEQREISCGYKYTPDMTPGTYEGQPYDGRMTNISGNHVALVEEGRAGPDILVNDTARGNDAMPEGSRSGLNRALSGSSHSSGHGRGGWNHTAMPGGGPGGGTNHDEGDEEGTMNAIVALRPFMEGLSDDDIRSKVADMLSQIENEKNQSAPQTTDEDVPAPATYPNSGTPPTTEANDDETPEQDDRLTRMGDFMKGAGFTPEQAARCREMCAEMIKSSGATDEDDDDDKKISEQAMDAKIRSVIAAERARSRAVETAKNVVRPLVGEVFGMDSATQVYRYALTQTGMAMDSLKNINDAGLRALVDNRIEARRHPMPVLAEDSATLGFTPPRQL